MPRKTPTTKEVRAWRDATQAMPCATDRIRDGLIDTWELRLVTCIARYRRLLDLDAPDFIVSKELGMIARALGGVLGADDLETFSLPSNADVGP